MKSEIKNNILTLYPDGSIDSSNAERIEKEIFDIISAEKPASVVIDAADLSYISSSGLRVILRIRKLYADTRVINVNSEVYEIFDITGFTEIVTVEKAYREIDVSGCEVIGEGANGIVYRIDRDTIVKVYKDAESIDDIKRERELARTAFIMGIPTAIPYDVVKVGDTYGSVFEMLNARSFAELIIEDRGKIDYVVKESVALAKMIHSTDGPEGLPRQSDEALIWTGQIKGCISDERIAKLKAMIEAIPETGKLIHGDLHLKNIMLQNDEALLIDMDTLCTGHPIYELAFMFNAYVGFGIVDKKSIEDFFAIDVETVNTIWNRLIALYLDTDDTDRIREVERKASLIGYLRILRRALRVDKDNHVLVDACAAKLNELIDSIDTLEF